jgi:hypothetical protein
MGINGYKMGIKCMGIKCMEKGGYKRCCKAGSAKEK